MTIYRLIARKGCHGFLDIIITPEIVSSPNLSSIAQREISSDYIRVLGELSKTRAKAIFELVDCGLVLAIREFEEDAIDAASLKNKLTGWKIVHFKINSFDIFGQ